VGIFVLSGAAGLIYQISWVRMLSLTFGVSIYAISTVVAAFMGGLALGSFVGGRFADRVQRPILWYAIIELIVAVVGLLSPFLLAWVQSAYLALYPRGSEEAVLSVVALRFVLAALVLLIPTTLMGATLPLMVKGSLAIGRSIGTRVSLLYASNTAGAIIGTVAAGFVLIGLIGISATVTTAAALNLLAAFFALVLAAAVRPSSAARAAREERAEAAEAEVADVTPFARRLVIITFSVQGFASLAYEIIWTRILALILDGSTYAFSIVLATVLLGIALGSALISPLMSKPLPWLRIYALLQAGVAACAFLGLVVFARVYGVMSTLDQVPGLRPAIESPYGWMVIVALVAVLPPMLLLGASFPVASRIVVSGASNAGRQLGILYAGNTAGAILGAWAAGFFLIPTFGTQRAIVLLAAINAVLAVTLALTSGKRRVLTTVVAVVLVVGAFGAARVFASDMYGRISAGRFPGTDLVWLGEGQETSVQIVRRHTTGYLEMFLNGQGQAADDPGMVWFHRLLGHLPMVLHQNPQDVLIVGLGGGATAGALAQYEPRNLQVVELSDTVVQGARYFSHANNDIVNYPGLHLKIDDGRNHLLLSNQKYDVITADVIHPRNAGSAVLYSYEYYKLVSESLKPGGIMAQWIEDNGENPDNEAQRKLMARTFLAAFPHATLWVFGALLIGSNEPINFDQATLEARWQQRNLDAILAGSGFDTPEAIRGLHSLSNAELRAWAGEGPIMTDDHPYVEYFLSLPDGTKGIR
jgi:spermidine synthase